MHIIIRKGNLKFAVMSCYCLEYVRQAELCEGVCQLVGLFPAVLAGGGLRGQVL